jgi:hypothetical protein
MLELRDFQQSASEQIGERFRRYYANPLMRGSARALRRVTFFQALASITASGKTVILADAVAAIAAGLPIAPVVVWLSKGKVVVQQTFANLSSGGKYHPPARKDGRRGAGRLQRGNGTSSEHLELPIPIIRNSTLWSVLAAAPTSRSSVQLVRWSTPL